MASAPLQFPEALHEVALVELHVKVEEPPLAMLVGLAVRVTVGAGTTVTVAVATLLVPPAPVQTSEYVLVTASGPVPCAPLVDLAPFQPPEAEHEVAFVELHVSVEALPEAMEIGFALSVTVGVPGTVTTAVAMLLVPPTPVQINEYELVAVSGPVPSVPLVALAPFQPPEAVHEVAFVELHVKLEPAPLATVVGLAARVTVGAGTTVTIAVATLLVPPAPVQTSEYVLVEVSGPVPSAPLVALAPFQPPEAVHEVALVELQVSVEAPPPATDVGFADSITVAAGTTVTVAVATLLVPPGPAQDSEYEPVIVMGPVLCVPPVALMPLQSPDAVHDVALVELHVSIDAPPPATTAGFALSVTVGMLGVATVAAATLLTLVAGGCVIGVTPTPPHAASSRDAPPGTT